MKNCNIIAIFFSCLFAISCVQPSSKKIVVFILEVEKGSIVNSIGVRGENSPLSWDYSMDMLPIKKDSLYQATVTFNTGYTFAEVKFILNDEFELKEQHNRRVYFNKTDTTFYAAKFNIATP